MQSTKDAIQGLLEKEEKILQMGGEKAIAKQKQGGKLTARERLGLLFDEGTFRELDMFVSHRCDNFGMEKIEIPSDGVITGHGLVDGRPVLLSVRILLPEVVLWEKCMLPKSAKL